MAEQRTNTTWQEFKVTGNQLLDTVKDLMHEGTVRRIQVRQEGKTILELPLAVVAVGALIAPVAAALGALAALITDCSIAVERDVEPPTTPPTTPTM